MEPSELRARWFLTHSRIRDSQKFYESEDNGLRSVRWKVDLGVLSSTDIKSWIPTMKQCRENYNKLKRKYIEEPKLAVSNPNSLKNKAKMNPLAPDSDNPWTQYFQDGELRKIILQDVERTFPDIELFREVKIHNLMTDVLFIYCKLNPELSYRQGMHELLAPLLYVINKDCRSTKKTKDMNSFLDNEEGETLWVVCDPSYLEHDSYALFEKLMLAANKFYELPDPDEAARLARAHRARSNMNRNKDNGKFSNNRIEQQNRVRAMSYPPRTTNPVLALCYKIHYQHLAACDPELFQHLEKMEIEPQLFGLRWLRLLFSREMNFPSTLQLWDGLFTPLKPSEDAEPEPLGLVGYVALAMLLYIRDEIVNHDYSMTLHKLMRFPALKSVPTLLRQAHQLQINTNSTVGYRVVVENYKLKGKTDLLVDFPPFPNSNSPLPSLSNNAVRARTHSATNLKADSLNANQTSIYSKSQHAASTSSLFTPITTENSNKIKVEQFLAKVRELDLLLANDIKQSILPLSNHLANNSENNELSKVLQRIQNVALTLIKRSEALDGVQSDNLPALSSSWWKFGYLESTTTSTEDRDDQWEIVSSELHATPDESKKPISTSPEPIINKDVQVAKLEPIQIVVSKDENDSDSAAIIDQSNLNEEALLTGDKLESDCEVDHEVDVKRSETTGSLIDVDIDIQSNNSIPTNEDEPKFNDEVEDIAGEAAEIKLKDELAKSDMNILTQSKIEIVAKIEVLDEPVAIASVGTEKAELSEKQSITDQLMPVVSNTKPEADSELLKESAKQLDSNTKLNETQAMIDALVSKNRPRHRSTDKLPILANTQASKQAEVIKKPNSTGKPVEKGKLKEFDWLFGTPPKPLTDKKLVPLPDITTTLQQLQSKELDRSISYSKLETKFDIKSPTTTNSDHHFDHQPTSTSTTTVSTPKWVHVELDSQSKNGWSSQSPTADSIPKTQPTAIGEDVFNNPW